MSAEEHSPFELIYFMFVGLASGAGATYILTRYTGTENLPHTVVVFVFGIFYAIGTRLR